MLLLPALLVKYQTLVPDMRQIASRERVPCMGEGGALAMELCAHVAMIFGLAEVRCYRAVLKVHATCPGMQLLS